MKFWNLSYLSLIITYYKLFSHKYIIRRCSIIILMRWWTLLPTNVVCFRLKSLIWREYWFSTPTYTNLKPKMLIVIYNTFNMFLYLKINTRISVLKYFVNNYYLWDDVHSCHQMQFFSDWYLNMKEVLAYSLPLRTQIQIK